MKNKYIKIFTIFGLSLILLFSSTACTSSRQSKNTKQDEQENIKNTESILETVELTTEVEKTDIPNLELINITDSNYDKNSVIRLDESGELYRLSFMQNIKKVTFYSIEQSKNFISFSIIKELKTIENVKQNEQIIFEHSVPEIIPSLMITVEDNNKTNNYLVCYNGKDGGANLIKTALTAEELDNSSMIEYGERETHLIDLDNDGQQETVFYDSNLIDNEYTEPVLIIDDKDFSYILSELYLYNAENTFCIANLNLNDNYLELIFTNNGDNDWNSVSILRYENGNITVLEKELQGKPGESFFLSDGIINNFERVDVLATTEIQTKYKLSEDNLKLEKIEDENTLYEYYVYNNTKLKVINTITVYEQRDKESKAITLNPGTKFTSTLTDGKNWSNVILDDGKEYWYFTDDSYLFMDDIDGLFFAG